MWYVNAIAAGSLVAWNLFVFILYGSDKSRARRNQWRISEKTLLLTALCFGGAGAFAGMRVFRHKTQHTRFRILVPLMMIIQLLILGMLIFIK